MKGFDTALGVGSFWGLRAFGGGPCRRTIRGGKRDILRPRLDVILIFYVEYIQYVKYILMFTTIAHREQASPLLTFLPLYFANAQKNAVVGSYQ